MTSHGAIACPYTGPVNILRQKITQTISTLDDPLPNIPTIATSLLIHFISCYSCSRSMRCGSFSGYQRYAGSPGVEIRNWPMCTNLPLDVGLSYANSICPTGDAGHFVDQAMKDWDIPQLIGWFPGSTRTCTTLLCNATGECRGAEAESDVRSSLGC